MGGEYQEQFIGNKVWSFHGKRVRGALNLAEGRHRLSDVNQAFVGQTQPGKGKRSEW
jgi:hypothetical protein